MKPILESLEDRAAPAPIPPSGIICPPFGPGATVQTQHGKYADGNPNFTAPGLVPLASVLYTEEAGRVLLPAIRDIFENQWYVPAVPTVTPHLAEWIGPETKVYGYPKPIVDAVISFAAAAPAPAGTAGADDISLSMFLDFIQRNNRHV